MRLAAQIEVLTGDFASQQLAFAHLLDAAQTAGLSPDLDHVEVMVPPTTARLAAYFDPDLTQTLLTQADGKALILVLPGALITGQFQHDARLTRLGRFQGHMVRA